MAAEQTEDGGTRADANGKWVTPEPWEQAEMVGQKLNADLHAAIGQEPCETACTHPCIPGFSDLTMLGFANSFARQVEEHLSRNGRLGAPDA